MRTFQSIHSLMAIDQSGDVPCSINRSPRINGLANLLLI
ncbi:hypothetical protein SynBOUM118_00758 [Synechococcus sp. BOUM118]|nr:hypothetical protein SynRS9915_00791 [Synechococcus sp. RS9915]QNI91126.1 hypothetical protein SynBOUM118_00758 [Synechococcus sp. BOUM118]QNJ13425.1 hypothetical protein SynA18461_00773 [Synechococcus sp. A18-46.1]